MIRGVTTNAGELARTYGRRLTLWGRVLASGQRAIAIKVNTKAEQLLTGGAKPGDYPVPVRTGHLRRSQNWRADDNAAYVLNSARYARAIHNGMTPYNNPNAKLSYVARPFLQDALESVDPAEEMVLFTRRALFAS